MTKHLVVAVLLTAACSKKEGGSGGGSSEGGAGGTAPSACKPLTVTVDGAPLPAMPHGLARGNKTKDAIVWEVEVFNHDKTTCEQYLNKGGRTVPEGEVAVRAFAGGAGTMGRGVGIGAHTQMGVDVKLVSPPPEAAGDVVKLCANNASFKPTIGPNKDKTVTIDGLLEGAYCGEMEW